MAQHIIDFHSHVLPGLDDGSKDIKESIQMIKETLRQGAEMIAATPHFYPWKEEPAKFLERRDQAVKNLGVKDPRFLIGAEVAYYDGIEHSNEIELLKITSTNLLLVELPMTTWTVRMFEALQMIENRTGLKVVIAHIDRYMALQKGTKNIDYACDNFYIQVNADYFIKRSTQRKALKLVKNGLVDFIGSDCHNLTSRPPNVGKAIDIIEYKLDIKSANAFYNKQKKFLEGGFFYER